MKCGAVEEWRRSVGPVVWDMKKNGKGGKEYPTNKKKIES